MKLRKICAATSSVAIIVTTCSVITLAALQDAVAQQNPAIKNLIPQSASVTIHAKIEAIDPDTRTVTLLARSGTKVTMTAGPNVRLEMLKVGDTVNAQYYRSVAFAVTPPEAGNAAPQSEDSMTQVIAQPAEAPGGIGVRLTKVKGLVVGIDLAANSVDLVDPSGGGIYTAEITDPARQAMLPTLKVGDTVTAVISQALAVSITPAPKSWF